METQKQAILKHLKKGKSITALEALKKFGSMRLAARINDLLNEGHIIKKVMVKVKGNNKKVARYSMGGK